MMQPTGKSRGIRRSEDRWLSKIVVTVLTYNGEVRHGSVNNLLILLANLRCHMTRDLLIRNRSGFIGVSALIR
jgi:hypothetical protein